MIESSDKVPELLREELLVRCYYPSETIDAGTHYRRRRDSNTEESESGDDNIRHCVVIIGHVVLFDGIVCLVDHNDNGYGAIEWM